MTAYPFREGQRPKGSAKPTSALKLDRNSKPLPRKQGTSLSFARNYIDHYVFHASYISFFISTRLLIDTADCVHGNVRLVGIAPADLHTLLPFADACLADIVNDEHGRSRDNS
jgi:hypothetical protein